MSSGSLVEGELTMSSVVAAAPDQLSSNLGGEVVILNIADGVYYGLGPVGARIWELIQEPIAVAEIRDRLLAEYDVDPDRCEREVLGLLRELASRSLLVIKNGPAA